MTSPPLLPSATHAANVSGPSPPPRLRVYLKVNRKRDRVGFTEDAPASQYVRVQWEEAEMGAPPAVLQPAVAAQTRFVFRRLQRGADRRPSAHVSETAALSQTSRANVTQVTQARQCVVIECGETAATTPADGADAAVELFVLDAQATEAQAMHDAFGEFAITDGVPGGWTPPYAKRSREAENAGADENGLPAIMLAPARRRAKAEAQATARASGDSAGTTPWGTVVQDDAEGTVWAFLREYDELLCVEEPGAAAADLYCYPDHRKDDEYDSNAEDFSGNDYPDDADEGSDGDRDNSSTGSATSQRRHTGGHAAYGMFCEDGYHERSLSSGWSSDDGR